MIINGKNFESFDDYLNQKPISYIEWEEKMYPSQILTHDQELKTFKGIIYRIINKINDKMYIGISEKTFNKRYLGNFIKNTHNKYLKEDIEKYGSENFYIDIYDDGYFGEELKQLEQFLITTYNSLYPNGYNIRSSGSCPVSDETRKKMSQSQKLRCAKFGPPNKGRKASEEAKKNMSIARKGKRWTDEQRKKMFGCQAKGQNHPFFGKKLSSETIEKIKQNLPGKSIEQLHPETKEVIKTFDKIVHAAHFIRADKSHLSRFCKKGGLCHGFYWKYKENEIA